MLERFATNLEQKQLLEPNQTYVVAVSGGLDSVVLLDLLSRLQAHWGWRIVVAHLDHAVRPESYQDAAFVGSLAAAGQHDFRVMRLGSQTDKTEAALRQARYAWLREILEQVGGVGVVTAHHRNDRLETALWHAMRGADRHGLSSMQYKSGAVMRPLLDFSRGEILHYAVLRDLDWREDKSNQDLGYTRNLIRHELMHYAPRVDPHYHNNLALWLDHLDGINQGLDNRLQMLLSQIGRRTSAGWEVARDPLAKLPQSVRLAVFEQIARDLNAGRGLTRANLSMADGWLQAAKTGSYSEALPGLLIFREYDTVSIVPRVHPVESELFSEAQALTVDNPLEFGRFRLTMRPAGAVAGADFITPGLYYVRRWEHGDRFQPVGMTGTKKVQDLFVDRKVPRRDRLTWPLVVSATNDIALIPGLARDRRFAATAGPSAHALQVEELSL